MVKRLLLSSIPVLLLTGCVDHPSLHTMQPQDCLRIKRELHSSHYHQRNNTQLSARITAADKALLIREYERYGCEEHQRADGN